MTNDNAKHYCATIGFFDGVHRGHQFLIRQLTETAHSKGMESMVVTFDRHPREVVCGDYVPQLITTLAEKSRLLACSDADRVEVLHFDKEMACLSAHDFMQKVLKEQLAVDMLVAGYDNRFGHNRAEGFDDYVRYGKGMGMEVVQATPIDVDGKRVSSSLIRHLLADGDVDEANVCLGHRFVIDGCVEHGFGEGHKIGFPTANVTPDSRSQLLPKKGVYAVTVSVEGGKPMAAMMNIGTNPTFSRDRLTLEAHIFDFDADLYGKMVRMEFHHRLRDEQRFESVEQLQRQLSEDMENAKLHIII